MPFLVEAQGLDKGTAGELLTLVVVSNMCCGLVYGQVIARHHAARTPLVLGTVAATATAWATVLAWPGQAPMCGCWCCCVWCSAPVGPAR